MFQKLLFTVILFLLIGFQSYGQIEFNEKEWYEIKHQSKTQQKPIFVDIYTDWCRPCKKMDTLTFGDQKVASFFNEHFINVKWNGEKNDVRKRVKPYGIKAYPTVLFLDHEGKEYKKLVGFQNTQQLLSQAQSLIKFLNINFDSIAESLLTSEIKDTFKMFQFLNENKGLKLEAKENVFDVYFEMIKDQELNIEELEVLVDNMLTTEHIESAIKNIPTKNLKDPQIRNAKIRNQSFIKAHIKNKIKEHLKNKTISVFQKYLDLNFQFENKINAITKGDNAKKENQTFLLEYYTQHRMYTEYDSLATFMIEKYILPFEPEMVRSTDKRSQEMIESIRQNQKAKSNLRAKVTRSNSKAFKLAARLSKLADNYSRFYYEEEMFEKALAWAELATAYMDIPEARLTRGRLLNKLNRSDEAIEQVNLGLKSDLLDWRIKSDLIGLQTIINRP